MLDPGWAGPVAGQSQGASGRLPWGEKVANLPDGVAEEAREKSMPPTGARNDRSG